MITAIGAVSARHYYVIISAWSELEFLFIDITQEKMQLLIDVCQAPTFGCKRFSLNLKPAKGKIK